MNLIRALRDEFSSDPAYHARRTAEKVLTLAKKAMAIVGDPLEPPEDVICSARNGRMRIDAVDFLEMIALYAREKRREANELHTFEGGN